MVTSPSKRLGKNLEQTVFEVLLRLVRENCEVCLQVALARISLCMGFELPSVLDQAQSRPVEQFRMTGRFGLPPKSLGVATKPCPK